MIVFPAIFNSCFGMSRPIRVPVPPASTTATAGSRACEEVMSGLIHPLLTVRYGLPLWAGTVRGASHHCPCAHTGSCPNAPGPTAPARPRCKHQESINRCANVHEHLAVRLPRPVIASIDTPVTRVGKGTSPAVPANGYSHAHKVAERRVGEVQLKVSVVIPVYNPGSYIGDCIQSMIGQSLPAAEYEVVFVDDGSTDDTPALLDKIAAEHTNIRVVHQQNSGWSGKPRNVGIDWSQGEYVMFVDHDDSLGAQALERMYEYGTAHKADIVIGKMAGKGRAVPRELFSRNRPHATLTDDPLIDSLTPHKMFRRAFLNEHELRFPEGRRRLEDHVLRRARLPDSGPDLGPQRLCLLLPRAARRRG